MQLRRRQFLSTALAASATAALASRAAVAGANAATSPGRDFYEVRCYRLRAGADSTRLDRYLEQALVPALGRLGGTNTGVFTELELNKEKTAATPKADSPVWVLITHPTLDSFVHAGVTLAADPAVRAVARDYLEAPKASPVFERIDSSLFIAFAGMPRLELPAFSRDRAPTRVFEMRDYESHSETKALSKMAMFDDGEITLMRDLGMNPVFFGEALAGANLPHLRYITSGPDLASHLAGWKRFGPDPRWQKMRDDPRYADNVSRNTPRFLTPKAYSQI